VRTPEGCASGESATSAAREVLHEKARIATLAGGCGIVSRPWAVAEAARAAVGSVVMASIDSVRLEPAPGGLRPIGRLSVVVVRDGQAVLAQSFEVATRAVPSPEMSRVYYDIAAAGFNRLAGPLQAVLADGR
jgi:hypothetical protein